MITEVDRAAGEFHKVAETGVESARLAHEAEVLAVARHPGVVELLGWTGTVLRLRLVDGAPPADEASIAVVVATTLADLHDIGVAHGALRAEHIIFDRGAPILCGFGRGRTGVAPGGPEAAADVRALAAALLAGSNQPGPQRVLARAERGEMAARRLARLLAAPPRTQQRPRRRRGTPPGGVGRDRAEPVAAHDGRPGRRRRATVGVVVGTSVGVLLGAAFVVATAVAMTGGSRHKGTCPAADQGCQPRAGPPEVVDVAAGRFRIGRAGDVVVLGRWQCQDALPALLQPGTGRVWVFDSWSPPGASRPARLLAQVPSARSLRVTPESSGCDRLAVIGPGDATTLVDPGLRP